MDESKQSAVKKVPASRSAPASDPFVFLKRNAFLQRISDAVRNGYTLYITGSTKVRLSEAPSYAMPVLDYDPTSSGSLAYRALAAELMARER